MQILVMTMAALAFGALATYLIATLAPEDVLLRHGREGRYAYLGEDDESANRPRSAGLVMNFIQRSQTWGVSRSPMRRSRQDIRHRFASRSRN
jgi:hypothetical protein